MGRPNVSRPVLPSGPRLVPLHQVHVAAEGLHRDPGAARAGSELEALRGHVFVGPTGWGAELVVDRAAEGRHVEGGRNVSGQVERDVAAALKLIKSIKE